MFGDWLGLRRTFRGGIYIPDEKALTARLPIREFHPTEPIHVPLRHAEGQATQTVVRLGEIVRVGQVLAEPLGPDSLAVHSPIDGRIAALERAWTARDGWLPAATIVPHVSSPQNENTGSDATAATRPPARNIAELADFARRASLLDFRSREPLHVLLGRANSGNFTLVVNAVETEPNLTSELRTLVERPARLVDCVSWLAQLTRDESVKPAWREVVVAVALRHRRVVRQLRLLARGRPVRIAALDDKFPQCHPALLTKTLFGRAPAPHESPLDLGAVILPLSTIRALWHCADTGMPCTSRVVTVSGDAVEEPGNLVVPFGTPIRQIIERVGLRRRATIALAGGPMTGLPLPNDSAVVTGDVAGVTLLSKAARAEATPCIRCGWCVDDCPVGIDPRALSQLELRTPIGERDRVALDTCIECGICSYVCPSALPLTESIAAVRRRPEIGAAP